MEMLTAAQLAFFSKVSRWFVLFFIGALIFFGVGSLMGLYQDGSNFLLNILVSGTYLTSDKARLFGMLITETPVVLAIKLGVHNLEVLRILHSFGLVAIPLLVWMMTLLTHYKTRFFWFFLLAFSVVYFNSGFFAVGEYNLTYAMAAWSVAFLIKERLRIFDCIMLLLLSFALLRSYEATIFLGPLLYIMALTRVLIAKNIGLTDTFYVKLVLLVSAFLYAASWAVAGWSILFPYHGGNLSSAKNFTVFFRDPQFIYSALIALPYMYLSFSETKKYKKIIFSIVTIFTLVFLIDTQLWSMSAESYTVRTIAGLALFFISGFIFLYFLYSKKTRKNESSQSGFPIDFIALMLFIVLSIPFLVNTYEFSNYLKNFKVALISNTGVVPFEKTALYKENIKHPYNYWSWLNPSLSLLLRPAHSQTLILTAVGDENKQPFDPKQSIPEIPAKYYD